MPYANTGGYTKVLEVYPGFGECPKCEKMTLVQRKVIRGVGNNKEVVEVYCAKCEFTKLVS